MVAAQPGEGAVQIPVHVCIVGMAFIHNYHFARQPQMPQHQVLLFERGHQQLVHRADDKIRQQGLLTALEPTVYKRAAVPGVLLGNCAAGNQLAVVLVQLRHAVCQTDGMRRFLRLLFCPRGKTAKYAVGRGLCGQPEIKPSQTKPGGKDFSGRQRRLGLADAHLRFQNQNARVAHSGGNIQRRALNPVGQKPKPSPEGRIVHGGIFPFPGRGQIQRAPGAVSSLGVRRFLPKGIHRNQGKITAVAGDPVSHRQKARQEQFCGNA